MEEIVDFFLRLETTTPKLLYIWGHSYEFDKKDNWDRIDTICEMLSGKADVFYATNIEIVDYINAYNALIFNAEETAVYNPTAKTIWFTADFKMYKVEPGETITI